MNTIPMASVHILSLVLLKIIAMREGVCMRSYRLKIRYNKFKIKQSYLSGHREDGTTQLILYRDEMDYGDMKKWLEETQQAMIGRKIGKYA